MLTRRTLASQVRSEAAALASLRDHPPHVGSGDETSYRGAPPNNTLNYIGNYTKGMEHKANGEVEPGRYGELMAALTSGSSAEFERLALNPTLPDAQRRRLVNPQSGLAFDLEGPDTRAVTMPPPPRLDSPRAAAEMAELYWMALLRDVRFTDFGTDAGLNTTSDAAASLSGFPAFDGPKPVTPQTLFRGLTPADLVGPYVSQFLLKPVQFGTLRYNQRQSTALAGLDYLMDFDEWLAIQNGAKPAAGDKFEPVRLYIRNMRDLATYVHFDALYEAYLNACLILLDMRAPFGPGNPYLSSKTQDGFGTFGGPHILALVTEVSTRALKAVWHQKWYVHRRLRPEAFGGLIHQQIKGGAIYPIHQSILGTAAGSILDRIHQHNLAAGHDSYLLPQAFPEGSPMHPAYGAGHATVAGACVTVLKAWFAETEVFDPLGISDPDPATQARLRTARRPKVPNAAGTGLANYVAPAGEPRLTVGGELNKLAANVAIGRNMAGVHWRSDYTESLKLGERIALGILEEQKLCYNEPHSFVLTTFDGTTVAI